MSQMMSHSTSPLLPVCSGPESLLLDQHMVNVAGVPSQLLMENAGSAVVMEIQLILSKQKSSSFKQSLAQNCAVFCGLGNNGADGLVVARKLAPVFQTVHVFIVSSKFDRIDQVRFATPEGQLNWDLLRKNNNSSSIECFMWTDNYDPPQEYHIIVDAILGSSSTCRKESSAALNYVYQSAFDFMNQATVPVISVDVPSGLCPTTGALLYARPVKATSTVTFGSVKSGLLFHPGKQFAGQIVFSHIGCPILSNASSSANISYYLTRPDPSLLPMRDPSGHKGSMGRLLVVGGCSSYFGAPYFACASFMRAGGGFVRLCTLDSEVGRVVAGRLPELVICDPSTVREIIRLTDSVVLGSGLGLDAQAEDLFRLVLVALVDATKESNTSVKTLVIDGDGLTLLQRQPVGSPTSLVSLLQHLRIILTPHFGELRRVFWPDNGFAPVIPHAFGDLSVKASFWDHMGCLKKILKFLRESACELVVVAKAPTTVTLSSKEDFGYVNLSGNAGMATAGSGDVLAGMVAAIGTKNFASTAHAVFVHGLAGDLAEQKIGQDGMLASDILGGVAEALRLVRGGDSGGSLLEKGLPRISWI